MKLLVIGAGMMGSSAAYDMARCARVDSVTLADADTKRAKEPPSASTRWSGQEGDGHRASMRPVKRDAAEEDART